MLKMHSESFLALLLREGIGVCKETTEVAVSTVGIAGCKLRSRNSYKFFKDNEGQYGHISYNYSTMWCSYPDPSSCHEQQRQLTQY